MKTYVAFILWRPDHCSQDSWNWQKAEQQANGLKQSLGEQLNATESGCFAICKSNNFENTIKYISNKMAIEHAPQKDFDAYYLGARAQSDLDISFAEMARRLLALSTAVTKAQFLFILDFCYSEGAGLALQEKKEWTNVSDRVSISASAQIAHESPAMSNQNNLLQRLDQELRDAQPDEQGRVTFASIADRLMKYYHDRVGSCMPVFVLGSQPLVLLSKKPGVQGFLTTTPVQDAQIPSEAVPLPDPARYGARYSWADAYQQQPKNSIQRRYERTLGVAIECLHSWMIPSARDLLKRVVHGANHGAHLTTVVESHLHLAQIATFCGDSSEADDQLNKADMCLVRASLDQTISTGYRGKIYYFRGTSRRLCWDLPNASTYLGSAESLLLKGTSAPHHLGLIAKMEKLAIEAYWEKDNRKHYDGLLEVAAKFRTEKVVQSEMSARYKIALIDAIWSRYDASLDSLNQVNQMIGESYQPNWRGNVLLLRGLIKFNSDPCTGQDLVVQACEEFLKISFLNPIVLTLHILEALGRCSKQSTSILATLSELTQKAQERLPNDFKSRRQQIEIQMNKTFGPSPSVSSQIPKILAI